jgi:hypothetical protein
MHTPAVACNDHMLRRQLLVPAYLILHHAAESSCHDSIRPTRTTISFLSSFGVVLSSFFFMMVFVICAKGVGVWAHTRVHGVSTLCMAHMGKKWYGRRSCPLVAAGFVSTLVGACLVTMVNHAV